MTLAIFDLDNTLLSGDSDYEWGQFLVHKGIVDSATYAQANDYFYAQYKQGTLDIHEFAAFAFKPLAELEMGLLQQLHAEFMQAIIEPMMSQKSQDLVASHKQRGDTLMVITATNSFVTAPIVARFGIPHLLATEPKKVDGKFVPLIEGTPCFQEGKVTKLKAWIAKHNASLDGSYFYSDSHNDLPMLNRVDNPVAVDPDDKLAAIAQDKGWEVISLRD